MRLPEPARSAWINHRDTIHRIAAEGPNPTRVLLHGGTILGARWHHRSSEDIDIFMPERESLNDTWPGGRFDLEKLTSGTMVYRSPTQVTIQLEKGLLDLSTAAPKLPGPGFETDVEDRPETVLTDAQILHGKLHRADRPIVRDAFDFITATKEAPRALEQAVNALRTVTAITLPRAKRPKRWKTGCARVQLTTLYPSLS